MKKKLLAASMALAFGGIASTASAAPVVNAAGIGHTLLIPYFTAQGDMSTLINIVNTDTVNAKAVKVRFRGASMSDDVFDFTVFMSPGDVFTGAVSQGTNGGAQFATADNSCTLPASVNQGFVTGRVGSAAGTLEGYVEVITMADIDPDTTEGSLYSKIKHVNGVAPCGITTADVEAVNPDAAAGAYAAAAAAAGFVLPTASLFANVNIVDVPRAAAYSVEATAIVDDADTYAIIYSPQLPTPLTEQPNLDTWSADDGLTATEANVVGSIYRAAYYDMPDLSTDFELGGYTGNPATHIDEKSDAVMAGNVSNEFLTDASILAATDWVFSMPTRRYYAIYDEVGGLGNEDGAFLGGEGYFVNLTADNTIPLGAYNIFDREENVNQDSADFVISPGTPSPGISLEGEVAVFSMNNQPNLTSSVLAANLTLANLETDVFADGWMSIDLTAGAAPQSAQGLPVIGFAASRASNNPAGGESFNFGAAVNHRLSPAVP